MRMQCSLSSDCHIWNLHGGSGNVGGQRTARLLRQGPGWGDHPTHPFPSLSGIGSYANLYEVMAKGPDALLDKDSQGSAWRQGSKWAKRWYELQTAAQEIRARSAIDNEANNTSFCPSRAAAAMDAERQAASEPFAKHCKQAPARLKQLQVSQRLPQVSRRLPFGAASD